MKSTSSANKPPHKLGGSSSTGTFSSTKNKQGQQSATSAPMSVQSKDKWLISPQIVGRKIDSPMLRIYVDNDDSNSTAIDNNTTSQKKLLEAISEKADKLKSQRKLNMFSNKALGICGVGSHPQEKHTAYTGQQSNVQTNKIVIKTVQTESPIVTTSKNSKKVVVYPKIKLKQNQKQNKVEKPYEKTSSALIAKASSTSNIVHGSNVSNRKGMSSQGSHGHTSNKVAKNLKQQFNNVSSSNRKTGTIKKSIKQPIGLSQPLMPSTTLAQNDGHYVHNPMTQEDFECSLSSLNPAYSHLQGQFGQIDARSSKNQSPFRLTGDLFRDQVEANKIKEAASHGSKGNSAGRTESQPTTEVKVKERPPKKKIQMKKVDKPDESKPIVKSIQKKEKKGASSHKHTHALESQKKEDNHVKNQAGGHQMKASVTSLGSIQPKTDTNRHVDQFVKQLNLNEEVKSVRKLLQQEKQKKANAANSVGSVGQGRTSHGFKDYQHTEEKMFLQIAGIINKEKIKKKMKENKDVIKIEVNPNNPQLLGANIVSSSSLKGNRKRDIQKDVTKSVSAEKKSKSSYLHTYMLMKKEIELEIKREGEASKGNSEERDEYKLPGYVSQKSKIKFHQNQMRSQPAPAPPAPMEQEQQQSAIPVFHNATLSQQIKTSDNPPPQIKGKSQIRKYMKSKKKEIIKRKLTQQEIEARKQQKVYQNLKNLDEHISKSMKKKYSHSAGKQPRGGGGIELDLQPTPLRLDKKKILGVKKDSNSSSKMSADFYAEYFKMLQQVKMPKLSNSQSLDKISNVKQQHQASLSLSHTQGQKPSSTTEALQHSAATPQELTRRKSDPQLRKKSKNAAYKLKEKQQSIGKKKQKIPKELRAQIFDNVEIDQEAQEIDLNAYKMMLQQQQDFMAADQSDSHYSNPSANIGGVKLAEIFKNQPESIDQLLNNINQRSIILEQDRKVAPDELPMQMRHFQVLEELSKTTPSPPPEELKQEILRQQESGEVQQKSDEREGLEFNNPFQITSETLSEKIVNLSPLNSEGVLTGTIESGQFIAEPVKPQVQAQAPPPQIEGIGKIFEYKPPFPEAIPNQVGTIGEDYDAQITLPNKSIRSVKLDNSAEKSSQHLDDSKLEASGQYLRLFTGGQQLIKQEQELMASSKDISPQRNAGSQLALSQEYHQKSNLEFKGSQSAISSGMGLAQSSLFDNRSFQDFTISKLRDMLTSNDFSGLVSIREEALKYRENTEKKFIQKMLKIKEYSPRTCMSKRRELEKWVDTQKQEIQQKRKKFEEEWDNTMRFIEQTQKGAEVMKHKLDTHKKSRFKDDRSFQSISDDNSLMQQKRSEGFDYGHKAVGSLNNTEEIISPSKAKREDFVGIKISDDSIPRFDLGQRSRISSIVQSKENSNEPSKEVSLLGSKEVSQTQSMNGSKEVSKEGSKEEVNIELEKEIIIKNCDRIISLISEQQRDSEPGVADDSISFDQNQLQIQQEKGLKELQSPHIQPTYSLQQSMFESSPNETPQSQQQFQSPTSDITEEQQQQFHQYNRDNHPLGVKKSVEMQDILDLVDIHHPSHFNDLSPQSQNSIPVKPISPGEYDILEDQDSMLLKDQIEKFSYNDDLGVAPPNSNFNSAEGQNEEQIHYEKVLKEEEILLEQSNNENEDKEPANKDQIQTVGHEILIQQDEDDPSDSQSPLKQPTDYGSPDASSQATPKSSDEIPVIPIGKDIVSPAQPLSSPVAGEAPGQATSPPSNPEKEEIVDDITNSILANLIAEFKSQTPLAQKFGAKLPKGMVKDDRGIKTDLVSIESYVNEVIDAIMENESNFIDNLLTPIRRNPLDILNVLQSTEIGQLDRSEISEMSLKQPVLSLDLYLELERIREEANLEARQELGQLNVSTGSGEEQHSMVLECEHIHNKIVFDSINESLNQFRPYGKDGLPLPWSNRTRKLGSSDLLNFGKIFEGVKSDIFKWAISQAGTLPRQDYVFKNAFDEDLFVEVREKRLAGLLASDVLDNEMQWLNYEYEETQVKIDVSDMVLEHLIGEAIDLMDRIELSRKLDDEDLRRLPNEYFYLNTETDEGTLETEENYNTITSNEEIVPKGDNFDLMSLIKQQ